MIRTLNQTLGLWLLGMLLWGLVPSGSRLALAAERDDSKVPGVVIAHSPASSRQFLGSPSLAVLGDGTYVFSHDYFGPGSTKDKLAVYESKDKGLSWKKIAEMRGQWWSSLFTHRGALYVIGTSREYGHVVIRRSMDGGKTWTTPADKDSGLLLADGKYHCAPTPVIVHGGRIWRGMEDAMGPGGWGSHFRSLMLSAPEDADLLKAENWTASTRIGRDPALLDGKFGGWLEGNAVATPEGGIVNILRADYRGGPEEKAALIRVSPDGKTQTFDPATGFMEFPGGCKKFTIRRDPVTGLYWTLANVVPAAFKAGNPERTRNTVGLMASSDLRKWEVRSIILHHPETLKHGFQYLDWQFEGDDLIVVCRTAFDDGLGGASNYHNANYMTFHRIAGFRTRTAAANPPGL